MQARNVEYSKNEDLGDFKIPAKYPRSRIFEIFGEIFNGF
jgi:hypothetical protein